MTTKREHHRVPWNMGKIVRQKAPLKLRDIRAFRVRLQLRGNLRDLALCNFAIDSKLRACDLLGVRVCDIAHGNHVNSRAVVMQRKTPRPVLFEITEMSRGALQAGLGRPVFEVLTLSSRVDQATLRICRLGSTPESFTAEYAKSACTVPAMERTACDEPRPL